MKIISTTRKREEDKKIKQKNKSKSINKKNSTFDVAIQDSITYNFSGTVEELLNELKEEEKQFLEKQSSNELYKYKSLVQKILKTILEEGIKTKTIKRLRRDRADFIIVEKINAKFIEIADKITNKDSKAFNLLKSVEEIRGLIFDLLY